jgi:hypothetical protein
MAKENGKIITLKLQQDSPKKNSVLFKSTDPTAAFQSVYMMRDSAKNLLGIPDLDKVKEIEVTVKVVS